MLTLRFVQRLNTLLRIKYRGLVHARYLKSNYTHSLRTLGSNRSAKGNRLTSMVEKLSPIRGLFKYKINSKSIYRRDIDRNGTETSRMKTGYFIQSGRWRASIAYPFLLKQTTELKYWKTKSELHTRHLHFSPWITLSLRTMFKMKNIFNIHFTKLFHTCESCS